MIRINLSSLAAPRTKGGKRRATPTVAIPGEGTSPGCLVLVFAALMAGGMAVSYYFYTGQHDRLAKDLQDALRENQRLAEVKEKYEASKKKADMFERRVKVIDQLKEAQKGPTRLFDLVAETVNRTDAVWLETMTTDGKNLNFTGMALSADAVADLMVNLRKSGAFKSVEIKETSQDASIKEVQASNFELICEIGISDKLQKQS